LPFLVPNARKSWVSLINRYQIQKDNKEKKEINITNMDENNNENNDNERKDDELFGDIKD